MMTNDERLRERREGAALAMEALARDTCVTSQEEPFRQLARDYRAGRWDADLSKGLIEGGKDAGR